MLRRPPLSVLLVLSTCAMASCARGATPSFVPLTGASGRVGETIQLILEVRGAQGHDVGFDFSGPEGLRLGGTARVVGTGAGGLFTWDPLPGHVGTHEFTFRLLGDGAEVLDEQPAVIEVQPSEDAAPVFLLPSLGATYDLTMNPVVTFPVEVRDPDTIRVTLQAREMFPEGATLTQHADKSAEVRWEPSESQIATAERWTFALSADDGEHPPVPRDHIVVLRAGVKPDCPGAPPGIFIISPREGEEVVAGPSGWPVVAAVTDDQGIRDAPLLYVSPDPPADPGEPDVTTFQQIPFERDGDRWIAHISPLDMSPGAEQNLYVVVSATDNDDPMGTACDHRTDSPVRAFRAATASEPPSLIADCDPCTASPSCASGLCVVTAEGGRCLPSCSDASPCAMGECAARPTLEGDSIRACGFVGACEAPVGTCRDDSREDDDTLATATPLDAPITDGMICSADNDHFRIDTEGNTEVTLTLHDFVHAEGDLDLQLMTLGERILALSAGTADTEEIIYCLPSAGAYFVRVLGYEGAENSYALSLTRRTRECACLDDGAEDDDTMATGRMVMSDERFEGTICPGDSDWFRFAVDAPSTVLAAILFDHGFGDLDLELRAPDGSTVVTSSGTDDFEAFEIDVDAVGIYGLRVFGFQRGSGPYQGTVEVAPR